MSIYSGIDLEPARRRASLDASPRRAPVLTDTRPNSTAKCWQILYFVLIEREARPHPDLTPVTSRGPSLPPSLNLAFSVFPCLLSLKVNIFRWFYYYMYFCIVYNLQRTAVVDTRRFGPRAAYAARYACSGRKTM